MGNYYCIDCGTEISKGRAKGTGRCASCQAKFRWAKPGFRESTSNTMSVSKKRFLAEHPETCEEHSICMIYYYANLNNRESQAERKREYFSNPENRQAQSERIKQYYLEHPEAVEEFRLRMQNYFENNPEAVEHRMDGINAFYAEHPEARSEMMVEYWENNPEAYERNAEHLARQRELFWSDPANHEWASEFWKHYCSEHLEEMSERSLAMWQDPDYRERGLEHIYNNFIPAWREWINIPENRQAIAERAALQAQRGFYNQPSSLEILVQVALDNLGITYIQQYIPEGYYRVYDLYLPDYNLLIEVDGYFWHASEWALANGQDIIDVEKDTFAIDNGYGIIRFSEKDLMDFGAETLVHNLFVRYNV